MNKPLLVAVAGGSGAGKTTLVIRLRRRFPRMRIIHMDHFYRREHELPRYWSPSLRSWRPGYNHPGCMDWPGIRAVLRRARGSGGLVLEGLFALHDPWVRRRAALLVFVECPEPERRRRILRRGVRGWSRRRHLAYWRECVEAGFRRHVGPTIRHADIVVAGGGRVRPGRKGV